MLAQAQQAVGTNSIDRFVGTLGQVVMLKPDVADKLDSDHWADAYGDMLGIDPEMIVPADKVALVRKARAEQAQKQAQTEQAVQASQALKNTSQVDTQQMGDIMDMFSGYTTGA